MFTHKSRKEKIILGISFSFLLASGLILGANALTITPSTLNRQMIMEKITMSPNNSLAPQDIMVDLNFDSLGTSYMRKLGIGTKSPLSALHVSGDIRANSICTQSGTCIDIANIGQGGSTYIHPTGDGSRHLPSVTQTPDVRRKFLKSNGYTDEPSWTGINTTDITVVGTSTTLTTVLSGKITAPTSCSSGHYLQKTASSRQCGDLVSEGGTNLSNYVTIDGAQTITGIKTFSNGIKSTTAVNSFLMSSNEFNFAGNLVSNNTIVINYRGSQGLIQGYRFANGQGDGGLADITANNIIAAGTISGNTASASAAGLMSSSDKIKLDGAIATPSTCNTDQYLQRTSAGGRQCATISAEGTSTLPTATSSTLGGVKIGTTLTISNGVLNYNHHTGDGNRHVPVTNVGDINKFLKAAGSAGAAPAWTVINTTDVQDLGTILAAKMNTSHAANGITSEHITSLNEASSANTLSTIVKRDSGGGFVTKAIQITQNLVFTDTFTNNDNTLILFGNGYTLHRDDTEDAYGDPSSSGRLRLNTKVGGDLIFGPRGGNGMKHLRIRADETKIEGKLEVTSTATASAFLYSSDRRLKENLEPLDSALTHIRDIQAYTFDWKKDGTPSMGFVAQDLQKHYPLLVHTGDNGYLTVDYSSMTVPLLQAVKELDTENQKLKSELASITQRLEALEAISK